MLRKIWGLETKLDWDDTLPEEIKEAWTTLFNKITEIYELTFYRALTPSDNIFRWFWRSIWSYCILQMRDKGWLY